MKYFDVQKAKMMSKELGEIAEAAYEGDAIIGLGYIVVKGYICVALAVIWVVLFIAEKVKQHKAKKAESSGTGTAEQSTECVQESASEDISKVSSYTV